MHANVRALILASVVLSGTRMGAIGALAMEARSANDSQPAPALGADIRAQIETVVRTNAIPGYAVAVVRAGAASEFGSWGNRTEAGDKVDENMVIGLGSMSKGFTAAAVGLVMDDFAHGRNVTPLPKGLSEFTWKTKVQDLLPGEWGLQDEWASQKASVRDIMSHVSGLPRHDLSYDRNQTAAEMIKKMRYLRPAFELREQWHYNNLQYGVAQLLVETFSKKTLEEFVTERIFTPLNMTSSMYTLAEAEKTGRFSQSWTSYGRRIPPHWLTDGDLGLISGAGGILTTATDATQWAKVLLGITNGTDIGIPEDVLETCMTPQVLADDTGLTYGQGWFQQEFQGVPIVFHPGGIPGVSSLITLVPSQKVAVITLSSADGKDAANQQVAFGILASMFGQSAANTTAAGTNAGSTQPTTIDQGTPKKVDNLERFAGTYHDPGYGSVTLCSPSRPSKECSAVFTDFTTLDGKQANSSSNGQILGYFPVEKLWAKYVRLTPHVPGIGNATFGFHATTIFPKGYGANTTAFEYEFTAGDDVRAEFVLSGVGKKVKGFGLFNLAGQEFDREKEGKTVQDKAEVWFAKTQ